MAGMGAGYDLSVSTISPDGRVFQVEYAAKAIDATGTVVGAVCSDGVIMAVEKYLKSKMLVPGSSTRVFAVDKHASIVVAGMLPDGRELVAQAQADARQYRRIYDEPIPGKVLSERLGLFVHAFTTAWSVRPFGCAVLLSVYDKEHGEEPELYCIEPVGTCYKYFGTAVGKGKQAAKTELEKWNLKEMTCKEAVFNLAKLLHQVHDESRDKDIELEMCWNCPESGFRHQVVPREIVKEAEEKAIKALEDVDMEEED